MGQTPRPTQQHQNVALQVPGRVGQASYGRYSGGRAQRQRQLFHDGCASRSVRGAGKAIEERPGRIGSNTLDQDPQRLGVEG